MLVKQSTVTAVLCVWDGQAAMADARLRGRLGGLLRSRECRCIDFVASLLHQPEVCLCDATYPKPGV